MARRESTVKEKSFSEDYAGRLLKRMERRLRRSAKNRSRREFAKGYNLAASMVHELISSSR